MCRSRSTILLLCHTCAATWHLTWFQTKMQQQCVECCSKTMEKSISDAVYVPQTQLLPKLTKLPVLFAVCPKVKQAHQRGCSLAAAWRQLTKATPKTQDTAQSQTLPVDNTHSTAKHLTGRLEHNAHRQTQTPRHAHGAFCSCMCEDLTSEHTPKPQTESI